MEFEYHPFLKHYLHLLICKFLGQIIRICIRCTGIRLQQNAAPTHRLLVHTYDSFDKKNGGENINELNVYHIDDLHNFNSYFEID